MDYFSMQELSKAPMNGAAQQSSHVRTPLLTSAPPIFQITTSQGHSSHDELNADSDSKKAYYDRAGEDDSATPSTSPSRSPSPSPMRSTQRTALDKPLEQLTEEDIMHLTREDCRRYLKEKGMRRPSWNKSQAIQQVLSLKGLFDDKEDEEKMSKPSTYCNRESSSIQEVPNPQQSRLVLHARKMPAAMSQQSLSRVNVGYEAGPISCKVPQRHGSDDGYTTHQPNISQLTCSGVSDSSAVGTIPRNLSSTCVRTFEHTSSTSQQLKVSTLLSQDGYSHCAQTTGALGTEPSAQLTIFYSGMVNVYDNVPADKAQAVMLLAARSNMVKPSLCSRVQSFINIPVSTQNVDASCWPTPHYVHSTLATTEVPLATVSPSATIPMSQNFKSILSEHQPSRKACLQRYLKKRRGRYSVKTPYSACMKGAEGDPTQLLSERYKLSNLLEMMGSSMGFPYANHTQLTPQSSGSETSSPHIPLCSSS